ncbi:hypothetical protein RRF57_008724 [Xylaria bambusicola]|uniref:Uncharacterized protein n=1 Tax=Xylaria bambusicola TaxID=326684 RepID=A0AAN7UID4_9PEZI
MILDIPPVLIVDALARARLHVVAHNLHDSGFLFAHQVSEESSDYGLHATAKYDNGHIVFSALF